MHTQKEKKSKTKQNKTNKQTKRQKKKQKKKTKKTKQNKAQPRFLYLLSTFIHTWVSRGLTTLLHSRLFVSPRRVTKETNVLKVPTFEMNEGFLCSLPSIL